MKDQKRFASKLYMIFAGIMLSMLLSGCGRRDDLSILYTEDNRNAVSVLQSIGKEAGITLSKYNRLTSLTSDLTLIPTGHAEEIPGGYISAETVGDGGFWIYRTENKLYLYSPTEDGLETAGYYFVHHLMQDGSVSLEDGQTVLSPGTDRYKDAFLMVSGEHGEEPVSFDRVLIVCGNGVTGSKGKEAAKRLQHYILHTTGQRSPIASQKSEGTQITLTVDGTVDATSGFVLTNTPEGIALTASDISALENGIDYFANCYLGYCYAGTEKEQFLPEVSVLHLALSEEMEEPWIEQREAIITLWNTNSPRGMYLNEDTSLDTDICSYSDRQLYSYVRMLKACGYNGIQVTDMCSSWSRAGGYEYVHDRIRTLFEAAHSLHMDTTLWVWGSEFTGYGWTDETVTYEAGDYAYAYENPAVVSCFDRYYSIYAELADVTDRVIGHFYDPGNLTEPEDIGYFCNLLRDKFRAGNPKVNFGVSCWVDAYDKGVLVRALGTDITLYEGTQRENVEDYAVMRGEIKSLGTAMGTWSWNNCEMEIDQLAQMNYNVEIIKDTYQTARNYDTVYKPEYWSEMDSNHVVNVFSLYAAGQLLQNPDLDTEALTNRIAEAFVGPEYAADFSKVLLLIQKARSGDGWNTYWWNSEDYILTSDAYDFNQIYGYDTVEALACLDAMIAAGVESYQVSLPISMTRLLELVREQVLQIRDFARFRVDFDAFTNRYEAVEAAISSTEDPLLLEEYEERRAAALESLAMLAEPIPEYSTVVGSWGQVEARAQQQMIAQYCKEKGIEQPILAEYDRKREGHILSYMKMCQKEQVQMREFYGAFYQYGQAYGEEETLRLIENLVRQGLVQQFEYGGYALSRWQQYAAGAGRE